MAFYVFNVFFLYSLFDWQGKIRAVWEVCLNISVETVMCCAKILAVMGFFSLFISVGKGMGSTCVRDPLVLISVKNMCYAVEKGL